MNAIDFLLNEHNKVRALLADLNDGSHRTETKEKLFEKIRNELIRHESMEQKVWYPKLKSNKALYEKIKHLVSEEKDAHKLLDRLLKIEGSEKWEEELAKLQDDVEHHATEEETKLFPEVKKVFDEKELEVIGKEMKEYKANYKEDK